MKNTIAVLGLVSLAAWGLSGCGNTGPLNQLGDPNANPTLVIPTTVTLSSCVPYSSGTDGLDLLTAINLTSTVTSPIAGIVSDVSAIDGQNNAVTIFFNPKYSVRITKLGTVSVRVGDQIAANQSLGNAAQGVVHLSLFVDGQAVCPYPHMDTPSRVLVASTSGCTNPCLP